MVVARISVDEAKWVGRITFIRVGIDLISEAARFGDAAGCEVGLAVTKDVFRVEPLVTGILAAVLDARIIAPQVTPIDRR